MQREAQYAAFWSLVKADWLKSFSANLKEVWGFEKGADALDLSSSPIFSKRDFNLGPLPQKSALRGVV